MRGLIFDLDGTLVDTVYAHVFAWQRAFAEAGLAIEGWRIHRRIGMSGGLFARAIDGSAAEVLKRRSAEVSRRVSVHGRCRCTPSAQMARRAILLIPAPATTISSLH